MSKKLINLLALAAYGLMAAAIVYFVFQSGTYPGGDDTMCHVYKGQFLYRELQRGNLYPLLDPMWYNGVEVMRYWAPLPVYVLAFCQALAGGNPFSGYLVFVGLIFFLGAAVWLYIGNRHERIGFGAFLGALWFFMPNNLYALFAEGNLPRALCMVFLPWLMELIHTYLLKRKWQTLLGVMGTFLLILLCHLGYAGMILLALAVFFVIYSLAYGRWRRCLHVMASMLLAMLAAGIWVVPSLLGGLTSTDSSETMKLFFQELAISLNPFYRLTHGAETAFYFGLAAFLAAAAGTLFGKKRSAPYFGSAVCILLCTSQAMYPVLKALPGSQYLWMLRFLSIALCMTLFGLLLWTSLKRGLLMTFSVLLVLDVLPSLVFVFGSYSGETVEDRMDFLEESTLIGRAGEITTQRVALMDLSSLASTGAFLVSDYRDASAATFGAGWQSANTASNIVFLNEAMEKGKYYYLFDRCLELGNDTVLIRTSLIRNGYKDVALLDEAAAASGYELVQEQGDYRLYHRDVAGSFGVVSKYRAIGIGRACAVTTMDYPAMEQGWSDRLDDYTYEELKEYELVFLNGFTYEDRTAAEELVEELSESGVRVVIEADGMPVDEHTGIQGFLGVTCQPILFENGYPILETVDGTLDCDLFPDGYTNWKTVFLSGLDECWGKIEEDDDLSLEFYGTVRNDNIVMIGLNLSYHYSLTGDGAVGRLLGHAMTFSGTALPERELVPLEIFYKPRQIILRTDREDVNATIAWHDIFDKDAPVYEKNNLTYVGSGETVIELHYPYLIPGLLVTVTGLGAAAFFLKKVFRFWEAHTIREVEITGITVPVAGEYPRTEVTVPEGAGYKAVSMEWCRWGGRAVPPETLFEEGEYCARIFLKTSGFAVFDEEVLVALNAKAADGVEVQDDGTVLAVRGNYHAKEPFRFVSQPKGGTVQVNEVFQVAWSISREARAGYVQVCRNEKWISVDKVSVQEDQPLVCQRTSPEPGCFRYRLAYVMKDGGWEYSDEFTICWTEHEKTDKAGGAERRIAAERTAGTGRTAGAGQMDEVENVFWES